MIASPPSREAEALERVRRLKRDFRFWARTCYRIRDKNLTLRPLILNKAQEMVERAEEEELARQGKARLFVLKGRQGGITTHQQGKSLHLGWSRPHSDALTLAHAKDDTGKIFQITRRAIDNFPPALLPKMGGADTYEVSFPQRDTHFWTGTAGGKGPGRGLTLVRVHGSEAAYWGDLRGTLGALSPGLEGVPGSVIVLETTASSYDSDAHHFWKESVKGETGYRPVFIPWWLCDPERYREELQEPDELGPLSDHERHLVERQGLTLEEVKWRRGQIRRYGLGEFLKEYPEDDEGCWLVAGDPFYNRETLLALAQRTPTPIRYIPAGETEPREWIVDRPARASRDGEVWIYADPPDSDSALILGADTAEGVAQDRSAYAIRSYPSWTLVEEFADSRIEPKPFAALIDRRGRDRRAFLVIEKNMHGVTVLRELRDAGYPKGLIYRRAALDAKSKEEKGERMGWVTSAGTYGALLDAGRDLINEALAGVVPCPSADTLRDAFAVQRDKDGAVSLTGKDMLVAELLAWIGRTAPRGGYPSW